MKLYHVSFDTENRIESFTPRVPTRRAFNEDGTVTRISLSPSVQTCLLGHPHMYDIFAPTGDGSLRVLDTPHQHRLVREDGEVLDGVLFDLYRFVIPEDDPSLLKPEAIRKVVPDALRTKEHWYRETLTPDDVRRGLLVGTEGEGEEFLFRWHPLSDDELKRLEPFDPYGEIVFGPEKGVE